MDTFDWRLHRAGLTLEHVTGSRPAELVLTGPAGERLTQRATRLTWPLAAQALPAGRSGTGSPRSPGSAPCCGRPRGELRA